MFVWALASILFLIIGFMVTMNYASDYFFRAMVESSIGTVSQQESIYQVPTSVQISSADTSTSLQQTVKSIEDSRIEKEDQLGARSGSPIVTPSPSGFSSSISAPTPTPAPSNNSKPGEKVYEGAITSERAENAQSQLTLKDKAVISSVLLKKLSAAEISLFVKMSGDGVSVEEKKAAKELILKKLTEEEYNELIAIAAKIGLSQGKNYQDSIKEFQ